jgi:DedD protein
LNRPIDEDGAYYERRADPNRADREISLGTATILSIFFGLAVVCACFFGFGYTMGHNSARTAEATAAVAEPAAGATTGGSAKPAAGSLAANPATPAAQAVEDTGSAQVQQSDSPQTATVAVPSATAKSIVAPADRVIVGDKVPVAAAPAASSSPQPAGSYMVQVAAVSSQDVADILLASLEKKGYTVTAHHEPQDTLLHVQIGPFPDRKDAEAMQKRVLADGFNAIVK